MYAVLYHSDCLTDLNNAYQIAGNNLEKIFTILKTPQLTKSFKNKEFCDLNETELKQFQERVDNVVNC